MTEVAPPLEEGEGRAAWGGKLEFILTCVGFAVGLGNVWRFPYLCYENGGGAFLIPYLLMLFLLGLPLFFLETAIGQFASQGPVTIWRVNPLMKGIGFASMCVSAYILIYFNVIISWAMFYLFSSMTSTLPWTTCDNWWNTELCVEEGQNISSRAPNMTIKSPSEEFFYNNVLRLPDDMTGLGPVVWQLAVLLILTWMIVFGVLFKGIKSLGKASYFMSLFPYVLLTAMLIRGATLEGAGDGIVFYLRPEWSKLGELSVWQAAATQIFFSLGVGMGALVSMSSFNEFNNNILRDAMLLPFVNCGTSLYAGFVIFSVLGHMAHTKGVDISEVVDQGPGLVFVVYPEGLATMPVAPLWSILFFFMMMTLGFSSQFSTAEGIVAALMDEFPSVLKRGHRPTMMRIGLCIVGYLLGLPLVTQGGFYLFTVLNEYSGGYPLLAVGLGEVVAISFIYGYSNFADDIYLMLGKKPWIFFRVCWCFVTPVLTIAITIIKIIDQDYPMYEGQRMPVWAPVIGWLVVAFPLSFIVTFMIIAICQNGGCNLKGLKGAITPKPNWGPALARNRTGKYSREPPGIEMQPQMEEAPPSYDNLAFEYGGFGSNKSLENGINSDSDKNTVMDNNNTKF